MKVWTECNCVQHLAIDQGLEIEKLHRYLHFGQLSFVLIVSDEKEMKQVCDSRSISVPDYFQIFYQESSSFSRMVLRRVTKLR